MSGPLSPAVGRVVLIGAGPGDPDLLTVRAARLLGQADVVLVDALVDARVLELCCKAARVIDVGKLGFLPSTAQGEINARLIAEARAGHCVVRLKGGDPFVFGRGGEEALALAAAGIPCEVVPGLSSALAVPALHNIPVTHRGASTSLTVLTGAAQRGGETALEAQWARAFELGGTLVFLMAVHALARIAAVGLEGGAAPDLPCALIESGATARERCVTTTLVRLADDARAAGVSAPAVLVIGDVVDVAAALARGADRDVGERGAEGASHVPV